MNISRQKKINEYKMRKWKKDQKNYVLYINELYKDTFAN